MVLHNLYSMKILQKKISDVRNEYVLQVKGTVVERKDKNPKLETGEIEVVVSEVKNRQYSNHDTYDHCG